MTSGRGRAAACALAVVVAATALFWSTRVAAGADAYGYVSQADLWLRGDLFIDQAFGAEVPWPMARWTFTPLGYRPEPDGHRIVPAYAPGLPVAMAAAKALAGPCAVFWIVPIAAGLLVFATYVIGARLVSPAAGLGAAWLVATSPTVLFMAMAPMSDVPAAAAWAAAVSLVLPGSAAAALAGGLAAGAAVLIRPNLAPLAGVLALWLVWRRRFGPALAFTLAAGLGVAAVATVNLTLYGSPVRSGYDLTEAFSAANVMPNLRRYGWWLATAETPLAAGLVILAIPFRRAWPSEPGRSGWLLLAAVAAGVWIAYLVYVPWDAWWYLRFLLPGWPMMALGAATLLRMTRRAAPFVFALAGAIGVGQAIQRGAFAEAAGESKYVEVARVVESLTDPQDVIVAAQHSGTLRYYAGRLTLRWDVGDPAWFDRTVEWLAANGHHPYLVVEETEARTLRESFGPVSRVARLDWAPLVTFRGGQVKLFDAVRREPGGPTIAQPASHAVDACARPKALPPFSPFARPRRP